MDEADIYEQKNSTGTNIRKKLKINKCYAFEIINCKYVYLYFITSEQFVYFL